MPILGDRGTDLRVHREVPSSGGQPYEVSAVFSSPREAVLHLCGLKARAHVVGLQDARQVVGSLVAARKLGVSGHTDCRTLYSPVVHTQSEAHPDTSAASRSGSSAVTWEGRTPVSNLVRLTMNGVCSRPKNSKAEAVSAEPEPMLSELREAF